MRVKNYQTPITKTEFKLIIKKLFIKGQEPEIELSGYEINISYNHPIAIRRCYSRLAMYKTNYCAAVQFAELAEIYELIKAEV